MCLLAILTFAARFRSSWLFTKSVIFPILLVSLGVESLIWEIFPSFGSFEDWKHGLFSGFDSFLADLGGSGFSRCSKIRLSVDFPFFMILIIVAWSQVFGLFNLDHILFLYLHLAVKHSSTLIDKVCWCNDDLIILSVVSSQYISANFIALTNMS